MPAPLCALTIGNFDGVHRGHRHLLELVSRFKRENPKVQKTIVVTFDPHPSEVLSPQPAARLSTTHEKTQLLLNAGIDEVHVLTFNKEFSQQNAEQFFANNIWTLNPAFIAIGQNFFFGKNREGSPGKILDWCAQKNIEARIVEPLHSDGEIISSTRIRELITEGKLNTAARLLGRNYALSNEVVHGDKRGRQLGFPTANLLPQMAGQIQKCLPKNGVYLTVCNYEGQTYPSVTNVGVKPTVAYEGKTLIESHLLDFDGDLYGKLLTVEFCDRIRDEKKFSGLSELTEQIQLDTQLARKRLQS